MIRPFTLVTLLLACSSGAWMFVVKHRADALEQRLGAVTGQIRAGERQIRVLKAEWALQTDPNRLAWLAQLFMPGLQPMAPDQLVTWKQLAAKLPAPGSALRSLPLPPPLPPGAAPAGQAPVARTTPEKPAQARLAATQAGHDAEHGTARGAATRQAVGRRPAPATSPRPARRLRPWSQPSLGPHDEA